MGLSTSTPAVSPSYGNQYELEAKRIERELALQHAMELRRRCYKLAEERERFLWIVPGGVLMSAMCFISSYHHKNLLHLFPVAPLAAVMGYQAHLCYGNKMELITKAADELFRTQVDSLATSPLSLEDVRNRMTEIATRRQEDESF